MGVYRKFDQKTLDREYRSRDSVPIELFEALSARCDEASARMRKTVPGQRDLPFGPSQDEVLELFPGGEDAPVFVCFHGGYWRRLAL